ncbi:hypothetical protein QBC34DRAFT_427862 [Podospora aff. communis PSN243]|uniref:Uncharacterized protein n=1 Tax=Podospora aff. communis PSN243 TaxID=3040156 RepID=A0AAV9GHD5_9PEZI|nr:hypothetical protein QBC34DRAFT_427862 [Podospora aff. communis PSN243]
MAPFLLPFTPPAHKPLPGVWERWADQEREQQPAGREFGLDLIVGVLVDPEDTTRVDAACDMLAMRLANHGIEGNWRTFLGHIFSAAESTRVDGDHRLLAHLVLGIAVSGGAEDPDKELRKWTNLSRFFAHLGAQQGLPLVLHQTVIGHGLSIIGKGLGISLCGDGHFVEVAAAWLSIAGGHLKVGQTPENHPTNQTPVHRSWSLDIDTAPSLLLPDFLLPHWKDPEANRDQRTKLRWLAENFWLHDYRARTWAYTILRTTYTDDAAVQRAVHALHLFVHDQLDAERYMVTQQLLQMRGWGKLPDGIDEVADPMPGHELFERFVVDVVEDREVLEGMAGRELCAYFKRWSLMKWHMEEMDFLAASPRLKTAVVFDEETVMQLQGVKEALEKEGELVSSLPELGRKFWVKMVEAVPEERGGPGMNLDVVDVYCMRLGGIGKLYWDRASRSPAYLPWKKDEGVPGGWILDLLED